MHVPHECESGRHAMIFMQRLLAMGTPGLGATALPQLLRQSSLQDLVDVVQVSGKGASLGQESSLEVAAVLCSRIAKPRAPSTLRVESTGVTMCVPASPAS